MSLKQPVQYPVKYYSHLDAGAPQLANVDGNIKTILKACLVTGIGAKAGAGWESLFEDDFRIVLRRPLRTGNPPDIKVENGVINGIASHRIVSQDNPTGLNDATELAAVNLLARDSAHGVEWYLIVSDFGFLFCYQMTQQYAGDRNYAMFVGSAQKLDSLTPNFYATTNQNIGLSGVATASLGAFFFTNSKIKDMRTGVSFNLSDSHILKISAAETGFGGDYLAQCVLLPTFDYLPYYIAATESYDDKITKEVAVNGRQMLRYVTIDRFDRNPRVFYIPLDYWEL